jgi:hypothetical protein
MMQEPDFNPQEGSPYSLLDTIDSEIEECERLESQATTQKAMDEAAEKRDAALSELLEERSQLLVNHWAQVATKEGVPITYKTGA